MDVVVIARLLHAPGLTRGPAAAVAQADDVPQAKFEIVDVLKGAEHLSGVQVIETIYAGQAAPRTTYLLMGLDPARAGMVLAAGADRAARQYLLDVMKLPPEGPERLAFFQDYLEDADETLSQDAYDEFADPVQHGQVAATRAAARPADGLDQRRQRSGEPPPFVLHAVGCVRRAPGRAPVGGNVCGAIDRKLKPSWTPSIACYVTLKGPAAMPLVEELFLKNEQAEYADTYAAIMALRFHGTETEIVPASGSWRVCDLMLERPPLADLIIPDLARWEDWSQVNRLVQLFQEADDRVEYGGSFRS